MTFEEKLFWELYKDTEEHLANLKEHSEIAKKYYLHDMKEFFFNLFDQKQAKQCNKIKRTPRNN
jgi:hypothetical protein